MGAKYTSDDYWSLEIIKFLKGELSISEEQQLHSWVTENKENATYFEEMRNVWLASVTMTTEGGNLDMEWSGLNKKLDNINSRSTPKESKYLKLSTFQQITGIAAMFIIALLLGAVLSRYFLHSVFQPGDEVCEMITPLGSKSQVILPDGTQVWLNAGSRLTYRKSFNEKDRIVTLLGEAFFHVKTNKAKPFVVQTSKLNVKATGTTFNVKAYPEDKSTTTTLVEGIVEVEGKNTGLHPFNITLKPKETITYRDESFIGDEQKNKQQLPEPSGKVSDRKVAESDKVHICKDVHVEKFTSWKDNQWQVEAENLENLSILLSRRFNVIIHKQSSGLKEYRFTGTICNETLEQVLEILRLTTPLKYKIGKGEVWWDIDPLLKDDYSKIMVGNKT